MDELRYARQTTLPAIGREGQQRLADATVMLVGVGGLGTPAALYLASGGVGTLWLNDMDTIDETNLARQVLFAPEDVGQPKAAVAVRHLEARVPGFTGVALDKRLDEDELAARADQADVVLDCSDNFATRYQVNAACRRTRTPLVSGAAIRLEGQLAVFTNSGDGPCYRCLYDESLEGLEDCAGQGILGSVTGTIGSLMATECIKLLLGLPSDLEHQLLIYDASGSFRRLAIPRQPDCPVCREQA